MQAARGAPGIDSCSMGEWALGRGLVVVCPPMAGSCINFLKPLTQTGNQPPEHSSINQRKNWQRNNLVGRRKGCTRKFVGNMKLQKSWISWLTIDGSGLLLFTKYFRPFLFPSQSNQSGKCSKCSKVFSLCYIWSRRSDKMFYLRLLDIWDCSICQFMFKCFLETLAGSCRLSILKCISIFWTDARGARKDL